MIRLDYLKKSAIFLMKFSYLLIAVLTFLAIQDYALNGSKSFFAFLLPAIVFQVSAYILVREVNFYDLKKKWNDLKAPIVIDDFVTRRNLKIAMSLLSIHTILSVVAIVLKIYGIK